jgi:hypothetical protein
MYTSRETPCILDNDFCYLIGHIFEKCLKNAHNSVTVQNRTHVHMNFFDHKDLGIHLLQQCTQIVKHPVYTTLLGFGYQYLTCVIIYKLFM